MVGVEGWRKGVANVNEVVAIVNEAKEVLPFYWSPG